MKVCIVSLNIVPYFDRKNGSQYGGAEVQASVMAHALSANGLDVVLAVSNLEPGRELPFPTVNAFSAREGVPGLRFFHPRLSGILSALEAADADVYYQHCAGMITGITSWFCKRHGKVFVYYAGSDTDFSRRDVRLPNTRDRLLFFYGLKNATGIVVQNERQAELCRANLNREPRLIPTGVLVEDVPGETRDGSIVWVGALRKIKRPELVLDLARRMTDRSFVIVGDAMAAEPDFGARILRDARAIPNVTVTGRVPHHVVTEYLSRASVLVNTSAVEGFPNAFLEAWKCATPTVSFVDVGRLISTEKVGALCTDSDDMVRTLERLTTDSQARADMGARARSLVEARFSATRLVADYVEYFHQLLGARRVDE